MSAKAVEPVKRFWAMVKVGKPDECWPWLGGTFGKTKSGHYGRFPLTHSKGIGAHRYAYEISIGPIPKGLLVCHSCDFTLCCNPRHLFAGTHSDNMQDCSRKGRLKVFTDGLPGDRNGMTKISEAAVKEIAIKKARLHLNNQQLGGMYGVTRQAIRYILNHRTKPNSKNP